MELVKAFRPNLFECLYDSAPSSESEMKRVRDGGRDGVKLEFKCVNNMV